MANAIAGVGTTFERWSGSAWQFIAEINAIEGPTMNKENIEVTALDADGGYDEFITGFMEGGTLTLNMNFTRSGYELMKQDFEIDVARDYRITLPDDEDTTLEFEGLVIEIPLTMEAEDKLTVDVTIQVTGEVALAWERYWVSQPEVLFFGLYADIVDERMPNRKTGSSDYLTVAGSPGSETYKCPNTAGYIAADTDYIWFKTDESQRTVTTAELIGYDLQRTPVKYEDESPNEIVAILILNTDLSAEKLLKLHHDFRLPILWSGYWVDEGYSKSNRPIEEQILWTAEIVATYLDTFSGIDGTLLSAHTPDTANFEWTNILYNFSISGNKIKSDSLGATPTAYFDAIGKADVDISIDLTIPNTDTYYGGLLLHRFGYSSHWKVAIRRSAGGTPTISILKYDTMAASVEVTHVAGVRSLRVVTSGVFFTVYLDGTKVIDNYESDGSWSAVIVHGIFAYKDATSAEILYDNFRII